MKILHLDSECDWRGGQNQTFLLARGLGQRGDVCYFALPEAAAGIQKFAQVGKVFTYSRSWLKRRSEVKRLSAFCRSEKIDVIDAQSSNAHLLGIQLKKNLPDLRLVVHRRVDYAPSSNWFSRRKYFTPLVDQYVAISFAIKDVLIRFGIAENKIAVVRSCVDGSQYQTLDHQTEKRILCEQQGLSPETILIGNASAFTDQKGHDVLIKALAELNRKDDLPKWHCVLAGNGPLLEECQRLARDLGIQARITFLGFITTVPQYLKSLDILAVSSNYEGLGTIILDGILAGCAVSATRVGGIPEMIIPEETGLLSEVGDSSGLANHLLRLVTEPNLRQQLSGAAQRKIAKEFALESMIQGNRSVYQSLLK